ncbi:GTP-binding protein Era [hydrothermal vent metagenome]|uniref:GTP-binding protein Era n=1 Tax=hydrothermal vent metagenome TaxID=652676 RepID=A0A3B0Z0X7_9ZZZZ
MTDKNSKELDHCGYIALLGRPNVGKSTLMNTVLGEKLCITSRKPQTTRHRILGIRTDPHYQMLFIDTPGLHQNAKKAINRYMNKTASSTIKEADLVLFLIEAGVWTDEDEAVLKRLKNNRMPVVLVVNKIDNFSDDQLLGHLQTASEKYDFENIVPISARKNRNINQLLELIREKLPVSEFYYAEDQITDRSIQFISSETIREKLMSILGQELPYSITVEIEKYEETKEQTLINAIIWVERDSQKGIVIGNKGSVLKKVGTQARIELARRLKQSVHLELWVKVKSGWADNQNLLSQFGYKEK